MFGNVVLEIPKDAFEHEFDGGQEGAAAPSSTPTSTRSALREVVERYKGVVQEADRQAVSRRTRATS